MGDWNDENINSLYLVKFCIKLDYSIVTSDGRISSCQFGIGKFNCLVLNYFIIIITINIEQNKKMEHRKEAEAVYFAQEDSHIVMSEKVSYLSKTIIKNEVTLCINAMYFYNLIKKIGTSTSG